MLPFLTLLHCLALDFATKSKGENNRINECRRNETFLAPVQSAGHAGMHAGINQFGLKHTVMNSSSPDAHAFCLSSRRILNDLTSCETIVQPRKQKSIGHFKPLPTKLSSGMQSGQSHQRCCNILSSRRASLHGSPTTMGLGKAEPLQASMYLQCVVLHRSHKLVGALAVNFTEISNQCL